MNLYKSKFFPHPLALTHHRLSISQQQLSSYWKSLTLTKMQKILSINDQYLIYQIVVQQFLQYYLQQKKVGSDEYFYVMYKEKILLWVYDAKIFRVNTVGGGLSSAQLPNKANHNSYSSGAGKQKYTNNNNSGSDYYCERQQNDDNGDGKTSEDYSTNSKSGRTRSRGSSNKYHQHRNSNSNSNKDCFSSYDTYRKMNSTSSSNKYDTSYPSFSTFGNSSGSQNQHQTTKQSNELVSKYLIAYKEDRQGEKPAQNQFSEQVFEFLDFDSITTDGSWILKVKESALMRVYKDLKDRLIQGTNNNSNKARHGNYYHNQTNQQPQRPHQMWLTNSASTTANSTNTTKTTSSNKKSNLASSKTKDDDYPSILTSSLTSSYLQSSEKRSINTISTTTSNNPKYKHNHHGYNKQSHPSLQTFHEIILLDPSSYATFVYNMLPTHIYNPQMYINLLFNLITHLMLNNLLLSWYSEKIVTLPAPLIHERHFSRHFRLIPKPRIKQEFTSIQSHFTEIKWQSFKLYVFQLKYNIKQTEDYYYCFQKQWTQDEHLIGWYKYLDFWVDIEQSITEQINTQQKQQQTQKQKLTQTTQHKQIQKSNKKSLSSTKRQQLQQLQSTTFLQQKPQQLQQLQQQQIYEQLQEQPTNLQTIYQNLSILRAFKMKKQQYKQIYDQKDYSNNMLPSHSTMPILSIYQRNYRKFDDQYDENDFNSIAQEGQLFNKLKLKFNDGNGNDEQYKYA